MKIGILTYYRVPNFGANLQAISTYHYLKKQGHEAYFIDYMSYYSAYIYRRTYPKSEQLRLHFKFIDDSLPQLKGKIRGSKDILAIAKENRLDAIIIGSDAVLQHFPLFSTLRWGQGLKAWLRPIQAERRFPNAFWGCGLVDELPIAMFSVSSQNSPYQKWCSFTKNRMAKCLEKLRYMSVRDVWTKELVNAVTPNVQPEITPDPVFAFNQNTGHLIPSKDEICNKFGLNEKYALVGLHGNILSAKTIMDIEAKFKERGIQTVAFPIRNTSSLPYEKKIPYPLHPLDWYGLLKYSSAYIGSNMHPIVVSLHNAVPCFSIDNWGTTNFWGKRIDDGSSKVQDILTRYGLAENRKVITDGKCEVTADELFAALDAYSIEKVADYSALQYSRYDKMMQNCLKSIQ